ncbi:hypothetical protein A2773_01080 [Candidatus Gottesmanbacteria bacterium RIFCSPHIGHO2_01_FULL_39_10]|uniref:Uncharacterized protein n=1 Tax=Candidatus Gottesmanbacteria bacterium RIFCSPHIGHO2_01_FULL_39_10 TaxID=1798375 RepID=A0A1F5ZKD8_9BACT|nr:MAG: hypothetical protein A2773_01080 [Candidatus Gottesmanbacteria bacterium RIFCSPHIGHO2_01_FULL_39_10]
MFKITINSSQLKVLSGLLVNLSAGLLLLLPTIRDFLVLIFDLIFAILSLVLAVKIEDILGQND